MAVAFKPGSRLSIARSIEMVRVAQRERPVAGSTREVWNRRARECDLDGVLVAAAEPT